MTSPNVSTPPGDAANVTSLRAFSEKAPDEWKKETYGDILSHFDFSFLALGKFAGNFFIRVVVGLFGGNPSQDPIGDFIRQFDKKVSGVALVQHTKAITKLADVRAVSSLSKAWQAMGAEDMATIPRNLVIPQPVVKKTTRQNASPPINSRNVRGYQSSYSEDSIAYEVPSVSTEQRGIVFSPILVKRDGIVDKMKVLTGSDPGGWFVASTDVWNIGLYAFDQVGYSLALVWDSGNIAGQLTSQTTEYEIDISIKQRCRPGQILFAAQRQEVTSGVIKKTRVVYGTNQAPIRTGSVINSCSYLMSNTLALPQIVSLADLNPNLRFIPWMAVTTKPIGAPTP